MAYIYCADVWCDDCGKAICKRLKAEGLAPAKPADEHTYDSDEYPKRCGDDEESDTPEHCAAGEDCLNAITLPGGMKVGYLFGELTAVGVEYVKEAIAEGGEVADLWKEHYADYL
jgi:hypothetical protein